ncbi:MAG: toll/interleukin-1 receptor domain-containing protein [Luteolibacter sp.]
MEDVAGNDDLVKKYWAFVSYSSKDKKWGKWLHNRLESFPIPKEFRGTKLFDGAVLGKDLKPCFRDRDELSGSSDLGPAIFKALNSTRYLIVLCSPNSAKSEWVNKEIEDFKEIGGEQRILALILDGEPNSGGDTECFPPALRYPAEPLAGDLRKEGDGKERGFLKVISGIAQLDFDVLYRRHERAQRKKRIILGVSALLLITTLSVLSIYALTQKKEAVKQTSIAVAERTQAQISADEARKERDNAKRTLANFYDERAEVSFRQDPDKSLAWSVKAAEINPEILNRPRFTARNREIIGQWSAPNRVIPSDRASDEFYSMQGQEDWGISIAQQRAVVISGRSKASLLDTGKMEPILEIDFKQTVNQVVAPVDADWFALAGVGQFKVYRWSDGSLLCEQTHAADFGSFRAHQNLATRLYRDPSKRAIYSSIIYQKEGEVLELEGPRLMGWNPNCFAAEIEKAFFFFSIAESSESADKSELFIHLYPKEKGKWERLSSDLPEGFQASSMWHEAEAGVLIVTQQNNPGIAIVDLVHPNIYYLDLPEISTIHGVLRDGKELELIREKGEADGTGLEAIDIDDLSSRDLLSGKDLSSLFFARQSGIAMGWERSSETFFFEGSGQLKGQFQLPTLSENYFYLGDACRMTEIAPNLIGAFTHNFGGQTVNLVDLSHPDQPEVFTGNVSQPFAFTSVEKVDDDWCVAVLSHQGKVLSQFSKLDPSTLPKTGKRTFQCAPEFEIGWHTVDNDGRTRSWAHRDNETIFYEDGSPSEIRHKFTDEDAPGWMGGGTRILSNGNLVRCSYRAVQIFGADGALEFEVKGVHGSFFGEGAERAVIASKEGLAIIDCVAGQVIDRIETQDGIERIFNTPGSDDLFWIGKKSAPGQFSPSYYLNRWSAASSSTTHQEFLIRTSPGELINELMRVELIYGDTVFLARSTFTDVGAESVKIQVLTEAGLENSLRLEFDGSQPGRLDLWGFLPDGSVVSRKSGGAASASSLSHHHFMDGKWISTDASLPSPLEHIISSPDGGHCFLSCQEGLLLYNTREQELSSTYLNVSDREVAFASNPILGWQAEGDRVFITQHGTLYAFSRATGQYIQLLADHSREVQDITRIVSSSNGKWISTTDRDGGVITTRVPEYGLTLEELRRSSNLVGGLKVMNDHDLVPWIPVSGE